MIVYDESVYEKVLDENLIKWIEKEDKVKVLFAGAACSTVMGYNDSTSDVDFYVIVKSSFNKRNFLTAINLDYINLDYINLIENTKSYIGKHTIFPTYLNEPHSTHVFNLKQEDYATSQKFFEILYSNYIYDSGFLKENIKEILNSISFVVVLDYYFSRAYGNLQNHLQKDVVIAKRYIRMFLGYSCMRWLIENKTIPNMSATNMIDLYAPQKFHAFLMDTLLAVKNFNPGKDLNNHIFNVGTHDLFTVSDEQEKNAFTLSKRKDFLIKRHDKFNDWMNSELESIAKIISKVDVHNEPKIQLGNTVMIADYILSNT